MDKQHIRSTPAPIHQLLVIIMQLLSYLTLPHLDNLLHTNQYWTMQWLKWSYLHISGLLIIVFQSIHSSLWSCSAYIVIPNSTKYLDDRFPARETVSNVEDSHLKFLPLVIGKLGDLPGNQRNFMFRYKMGKTVSYHLLPSSSP